MLPCGSVYSITPNSVGKTPLFSYQHKEFGSITKEFLPCWMIPYSWLYLGVPQSRDGTVMVLWESGQEIPAPFSVCSMWNGNAKGREISCFDSNKTSPKFWIDFSRDSSLQHFRRSSRLGECGNAVRHVLSAVLNSSLVLIFVDPFNPWTVAEEGPELTKSLRALCSKQFRFMMALEIFLWRVCDIGWNFIRPTLENQFTKGRSRKVLVNH